MPTPGDGLDGNSPEIAAAIEAVVKDGMNVLNFSIGEPEVTPKRDVVVDAIQAASAAGVVASPRRVTTSATSAPAPSALPPGAGRDRRRRRDERPQCAE